MNTDEKLSVQDFLDMASELLNRVDNFNEIYLKGKKTSIKITKEKTETKKIATIISIIVMPASEFLIFSLKFLIKVKKD